jgi:hypothetical protein
MPEQRLQIGFINPNGRLSMGNHAHDNLRLRQKRRRRYEDRLAEQAEGKERGRASMTKSAGTAKAKPDKKKV